MTYADGTGGHQGDASEDAEPYRRKAQAKVYRFIVDKGEYGATSTEVEAHFDDHHGVSSAALSNLHMDGHITKLKRRRKNSGIYILPRYINGEETVRHRSNSAKYRARIAELEEELAECRDK